MEAFAKPDPLQKQPLQPEKTLFSQLAMAAELLVDKPKELERGKLVLARLKLLH